MTGGEDLVNGHCNPHWPNRMTYWSMSHRRWCATGALTNFWAITVMMALRGRHCAWPRRRADRSAMTIGSLRWKNKPDGRSSHRNADRRRTEKLSVFSKLAPQFGNLANISRIEGLQMRRLICVLAMLIATLSHAKGADGYIHGSTMETAVLARQCAVKQETSLEADMCVSYILGVYDALSTSRVICPGPGSSTLQAVVIGRRRLAENPADWSKSAAFLIGASLKRAFPCPKR